MTKMGRPVVGEPLIINIKARIDEKTNIKLLEYCKRHNISKTDVIRKGIDMVLKEEK